MASAATRRPRPEAQFSASSPTAEERVLLDALPIAAAVILRSDSGVLELGAFNRRFEEAVAQSTVPGFDKVTETCLRDGTLHDHLQGWFDRRNPDELDFRDGWGLEARHYRLRLAPLPRQPGSAARALLSVVDRTTEVRTEHSLREEMLRDSLTGLPNRVAFAEMIEAATLDKGDGRGGHAVLVVDLARFSRINESMGSLAGDELLITFARRLISALRAGDRLARTGGNEFGIIVALRRGVPDATRAADRILETLSTPFRLSELEIRVECAIGVALATPGADAEELFRNAQFACKQAKGSGRPEIYEPGEASAARRRFSIETELRRALDRDQLELAYQPLIDLRSGEVAGFEALARWNHPDRGEISPNEFIPVAEESGLILSLGRWAMHRAAASIAQWDRAAGETLPVNVGVNLSAIQVARDDVAKVVDDALRAAKIGGDRLSLELTESCIVQDPGRATRVFDALKSLDTTLAMDDFGTGYSSLAYLQRLPIDVLKIDRSFVSALMVDPDSVAIVRAVLSLAEALNMKTTAEGIETRELAATLGALGCDHGQGFYYARPLSEQDALEFWRSRRRRR